MPTDDKDATGERLSNPAADQAPGQFLNPVEQKMSNAQPDLENIAASKHAYLWAEVWGSPISAATPTDVATNYDRVGVTVGA